MAENISSYDRKRKRASARKTQNNSTDKSLSEVNNEVVYTN